MSRDLLLGRTPRDWSRSSGRREPSTRPSSVGAVDSRPVALSPRTPEPTTESLLELNLAAKRPVKPSRSVERMVKDAVREASPGVMKAYEDYRPTYRGGAVVLRMKADPLKGG